MNGYVCDYRLAGDLIIDAARGKPEVEANYRLDDIEPPVIEVR